MTAISDSRDVVSTGQERQSQLWGGVPTWERRYSRWLLAVDTLAVVMAVGLAQWLRFGGLDSATGYRAWSYYQLSAVLAVAWLLALSINHSRSERIIGSGAEEYRRVWMATIFVFGTVAIASMLFKLEIARGYLMIALPVGALFLLIFRWFARRIVRRARVRHGRFVTRIIAVGSVGAVQSLTSALFREPRSRYQVVGACVPENSSAEAIQVPGLGSIPVLGNESDVAGAVASTNSSAVLAAFAGHLDGGRIRQLSWELERLDIDLMVAPGVVDVAGPRLHMRPVAGLPLIHVEKPQYHGAKRFQKRLFDLAFSSSVLLLGMPLFAAIAIGIKLTSKGSVFYRHERIGLDGQTFAMLKFRTMVVGADTLAGDLTGLNLVASPRDPFKFEDDPRVTGFGRILRKYSLDELPQFINVLKRDMSVVGPRPQVRREVDAYDEETKRRLLVRPGITGLWQVSGRSDLSWEDSVRLDLFYVENWSMMADMLIALQTVRVMFNRAGAY